MHIVHTLTYPHCTHTDLSTLHTHWPIHIAHTLTIHIAHTLTYPYCTHTDLKVQPRQHSTGIVGMLWPTNIVHTLTYLCCTHTDLSAFYTHSPVLYTHWPMCILHSMTYPCCTHDDLKQQPREDSTDIVHILLPVCIVHILTLSRTQRGQHMYGVCLHSTYCCIATCRYTDLSTLYTHWPINIANTDLSTLWACWPTTLYAHWPIHIVHTLTYLHCTTTNLHTVHTDLSTLYTLTYPHCRHADLPHCMHTDLSTLYTHTDLSTLYTLTYPQFTHTDLSTLYNH